jgi:hypothetical protein
MPSPPAPPPPPSRKEPTESKDALHLQREVLLKSDEINAALLKSSDFGKTVKSYVKDDRLRMVALRAAMTAIGKEKEAVGLDEDALIDILREEYSMKGDGWKGFFSLVCGVAGVAKLRGADTSESIFLLLGSMALLKWMHRPSRVGNVFGNTIAAPVGYVFDSRSAAARTASTHRKESRRRRIGEHLATRRA